MTDQQSLLDAIEKSNKALADFKAINEQKLKAAADKAAEFEEKMKKAFEDIDKWQKIAEKLEAKLTNRPGNGGAGGETQEKEAAHAAHRKAFMGYVRKGTEYNGAELEMKSLDWTNPAEGGYAVPKVVDQSIESIVINISPIRQLATVQQVSTTDFHKLVNLRGTVSGWVGEMAARPATATPTLIDVVPPMGELYANPQATQQMLDDVFFNAEAWLADNVATEFARAEGAAFMNGTGINQPKGITAYTFAATADDVRAFGSIQYIPTGAAAGWLAPSTTVNPADVLFTAAGSIKAAYRQGSVWLMPKSVLFAIAAFKDSQGRYVYNPISQPGMVANLMGYPVYEVEDLAPMGANAYSIVFGNLKKAYLIIDRMGTRVLRDPFTNKPYVGFYTTKRVGGGLVMSEAIKVIKFAVS